VIQAPSNELATCPYLKKEKKEGSTGEEGHSNTIHTTPCYTYIPPIYFRIRHFRTRHVTSRSQKPWQQSPRQEARFLLRGRDGHTAKKIKLDLFLLSLRKGWKVLPECIFECALETPATT